MEGGEVEQMTENITRDIAVLVSVISIALLGVTFVLISLAWKGFESRFTSLPRSERRELVKRCFISITPILILVIVVTVVGVNSPDLVQLSAFLVMLGLGAIAILYLLVSGIQRFVYFISRRNKESSSVKLDESTTLYFISLLFLAISVFCTVWALIGIIPSALEINISPYQAQDFNWARWFLIDGILFFVAGIFGTGISYLSDRSRYWKN